MKERPPVAATIGVFDGVHRGHRYLLESTRTEAERQHGDAVVFTFDPHPARILAPARAPQLLSTRGEKEALLAALGFNQVLVVRFDREMSQLLPEEFLDREVFPVVNLRHLVIGHDFALGRDRVGDARRLADIGRIRGFQVTQMTVLRYEGEVVSSSRIREAVHAGDLDRAAGLLGRRYGCRGPVVSGDGRGRTLGYPTANLDLPAEKMMPPFGVYAVQVRIEPGEAPLPGVMNFGIRPTFGGEKAAAEVHLIGFDGRLEGRILNVEFAARLREERRFGAVADLVRQIEADVAAARERLEKA